MAKAPAILGVLALPNNLDASRPFQKLLHAPCGLPDPLLVLDQRDPHEPLAFLTKARARRHRDARLGQQPFGEFHRTQVPEGLRYRSEEHTSELQSLMRISYAVFCLKKKKHKHHQKILAEYKHDSINKYRHS